MKRIDGQIWIDKKPPYRMKYHINGVDYVLEVSATYKPDEGGGTANLDAGTVVTLKGENTIAPAVFPDDVNGILGITLNATTEDVRVASVTQSGYLILDTPEEIASAFPFPEDLDVTKNLWGNDSGGVGAPVYWYIGKTVRTVQDGSVTYAHRDSSEEGYKGKLTFQTPSGFKWNQKTVEDDTMNIAYDNLPIIGTVASYTLKDNILQTLAIHVNFSKFDSSVEWNWPYLHVATTEEGACGRLNGRATPYVFRHGLFADNNYYSQVSSYIDISASKDGASVKDGTDYHIETISKDITTGNDRHTEILLRTPEAMNYRISGEVHYKFDREHK